MPRTPLITMVVTTSAISISSIEKPAVEAAAGSTQRRTIGAAWILAAKLLGSLILLSLRTEPSCRSLEQ